MISHSRNVYVMPFDFEARGQGVAIDNFWGRSRDSCRFYQTEDRRKDHLCYYIPALCAEDDRQKNRARFKQWHRGAVRLCGNRQTPSKIQLSLMDRVARIRNSYHLADPDAISIVACSTIMGTGLLPRSSTTSQYWIIIEAPQSSQVTIVATSRR